MMKTIIFALTLNMFFSFNLWAQRSLDDFVPLKSSRADVEKVLGKGKQIDSNRVQYNLPNEEVTFNYYNGGCDSSFEKDMKMSFGTIIEIRVDPKDNLNLKDFAPYPPFDWITSFEDSETYMDAKQGKIIVSKKVNNELVKSFYYVPKDRKLPECLVYKMEAKSGFAFIKKGLVYAETRPYIDNRYVGGFEFLQPLKYQNSVMDIFANLLKKYPVFEGDIYLLHKKNVKRDTISAYIQRIKIYLSKVKGINLNRLKFVDVRTNKQSRVVFHLRYKNNSSNSVDN